MRAKKILEKKQYPEPFYEPIINETLTKFIQKDNVCENEASVLNLSDISSSAEIESVTQNNDIAPMKILKRGFLHARGDKINMLRDIFS